MRDGARRYRRSRPSRFSLTPTTERGVGLIATVADPKLDMFGCDRIVDTWAAGSCFAAVVKQSDTAASRWHR